LVSPVLINDLSLIAARKLLAVMTQPLSVVASPGPSFWTGGRCGGLEVESSVEMRRRPHGTPRRSHVNAVATDFCVMDLPFLTAQIVMLVLVALAILVAVLTLVALRWRSWRAL
jgi:hypothetical protein